MSSTLREKDNELKAKDKEIKKLKEQIAMLYGELEKRRMLEKRKRY